MGQDGLPTEKATINDHSLAQSNFGDILGHEMFYNGIF